MSLRYDRELRWRRELEEREPVIRQLVGHARCLADATSWRSVTGERIDVYDVLAALADTGLCLVRDAEGFGQDAARWAAFLIVADPLDVEPEIESHWDVEEFDREQAAMRPTRRRFDQPPEGP